MLSVVSCVGGGEESGSGASSDELWWMARESLAQLDGEIALEGLSADVEVIRDRWGVPHIYASNQDDLFLAQGFVAAQDRLWQMEMWRLWAQGRRSEVEGPAGVAADRFTRLLDYRGEHDDNEYGSYHPEGQRILESFVAGINAFIDHRSDNLPIEFKLTGFEPEHWSPDIPTLRTAAGVTAGGVGADLRLARRVAELGAEEANRRAAPDPFYELVVPEGLNVSLVTDEVIGALGARGGRVLRVELLPEFRDAVARREAASPSRRPRLSSLMADPWGNLVGLGFEATITPPLPTDLRDQIGSNNWVLSGALTASGKPMLANDPHRQVMNPSLRYLVHLSAPGWNVIGAGEPVLPGVAIGHNERIAWGLTIVGTDQNDVFVEALNPENHDQVLYRGQWEGLRTEQETIRVKGGEDVEVELRFSRHGPVFFIDEENHVAYALRSFAHEPGTAPYLGGLRVDQAQGCREFLEQMAYWKAPSENMICGDVDGNIGWRASALTPSRRGPTPWYGRLPVPGTGEYGWSGFRDDLPEEYNPERGWIATANHNVQPAGYHPPLMFKGGPPYRRFERIAAVLEGAAGFTIDDSKRLQHDAYSSSAVEALPVFRGWTSEDSDAERARRLLAEWDGVFDRESVAAAIYRQWRRRVSSEAFSAEIDEAQRRELVQEGLRGALAALTEELGEDRSAWRWGRLNEQDFPHWLVPVFDLPSVEKTGGAGTVYANGATYREIFDLSDWDLGVATTAPGQSGEPGSPFYGDRAEDWANGVYFPLLFSRGAIEENAAYRLRLKPRR